MHHVKVAVDWARLTPAVVIVWAITATTGYAQAAPSAAWLPTTLYLLLGAYVAWWRRSELRLIRTRLRQATRPRVITNR